MKTISDALKAHIQGQATTVATCWKLTRKDGIVLGFTDSQADVIFNGITYMAQTGHTPSALATSAELSVNTQESSGILRSDTLTDEDILSGKWDSAVVEIFIVNYKDLSMGSMTMITGTIGEIKTGRAAFTAEIRSLTQALQQTMGQLVQPACTAEFGDAKCKINAAAFTFTGSITTLDSNVRVGDSAQSKPDGYFQWGILTFTGGANAGVKRRVKLYEAGGWFTLAESTVYPIAIGDTYSAIAGCDHTTATCNGTYNNIINFRGFPNLPGRDILQNGGKA